MFDRIRKAFMKEAKDEPPPSSTLAAPVSEWAATQGFGFSVDDTGQNIALEGKVAGRPWKLVLGRPTRNYIFGEEVRARAELGIDDNIAVLVLNRPLKEALEKRAFDMYTDSLQTQVDSSMPEEMRWLAMFDEVGWEGGLPQKFWDRMAILTDNRDNAMKWMNPSHAMMMVDWPSPAPSPEVPFLILLLNGKAYLRMEYTPAVLFTLQHAAKIFTVACENALAAFRRR